MTKEIEELVAAARKYSAAWKFQVKAETAYNETYGVATHSSGNDYQQAMEEADAAEQRLLDFVRNMQ